MQQTQIFYQTVLKKISITKTGIVRNNKNGRFLKVSDRGYFVFNTKAYNLPKLMLQTFKKVKIKNGRIKFKDSDKRNFNIENIDYVTNLPNIQAPSKKDLENIINHYFNDAAFKMGDWMQYRIYLKMIAEQRGFFEQNKKEININVFSDYLSVSFPNFSNLAKRNDISVLDAKRTVYYFLNKVINDFRDDSEFRT